MTPPIRGVMKPKNDVFRKGSRLRFDVFKGSTGVKIKVFGKMPSQGVLVFMYHQNSQQQKTNISNTKEQKKEARDNFTSVSLTIATRLVTTRMVGQTGVMRTMLARTWSLLRVKVRKRTTHRNLYTEEFL